MTTRRTPPLRDTDPAATGDGWRHRTRTAQSRERPSGQHRPPSEPDR